MTLRAVWVVEYRYGTGPWEFINAYETKREAIAEVAGSPLYRIRKFVPEVKS